MTDSYVIVMERPLRSQDLFDYITGKGHLGESEARRFFREIVEAVGGCEEAGVFHRDLKDENILVDKDTGNLKIIDFGSGTVLKNGAYTTYDGYY